MEQDMLTTKPAFSNNKSKDKWKPQNKKSNKIKLVTCPHNVYLWVQFVSQCDKVVRCLYRWNGSCATIFYTRKKKQHHSKTMVTISEHPQNLQIAQIPFTSSPTFSLEWGKDALNFFKRTRFGLSVSKIYWPEDCTIMPCKSYLSGITTCCY